MVIYPLVVQRINELVNHYKLPMILSLVGLVLIAGGIFASQPSQKTLKNDFPKESIVKGPAELKADISGAVKEPGVYTLASGDRVEDVIKRAGGFAENANREYIAKRLNLSLKVSDGLKLYIPFEGEAAVVQISNPDSQAPGGKIGLNSASSGQLEALDGVGPATASKIISSRPYQDIADLKTKKVVSNSVYEKIKDSVDLN